MDQSKTQKKTKKASPRKVNIPETMAVKIDEIRNKNEELGFKSLDEFVREATRVSIIKYSQIIKNKASDEE